MYRFLLVAVCFFFFAQGVNAQELKNPLPDKEVITELPPSPGEDYTWVKGHWEFEYTKYVWVEGHYIQNKEQHIWVDAEWGRNKKTGWWTMEQGYWQKTGADLSLEGGEKTVSGFTIDKSSPFKNVYSDLANSALK